MTKKEIISMVNSIKDRIDVKKAIKNDEKKDEKNDRNKTNKDETGVGINQFRELSAICKVCEVYEEVEILLKYKKAKAEENKSWKVKKNGEKCIGDIILKNIQDIHGKYPSDEECLKALSLFFGYLYQSARVWKDEVKGDDI